MTDLFYRFLKDNTNNNKKNDKDTILIYCIKNWILQYMIETIYSQSSNLMKYDYHGMQLKIVFYRKNNIIVHE